MSNVKKFLNINNIEDENKGISFPYIKRSVTFDKRKIVAYLVGNVHTVKY